MASNPSKQSPASRSPSPARPPPTPAAPGPRAAALQKLYADAIAHVLKTCSYTNFSSCFPTPAREVPGSVKHMHEQFIAKLGESMHREFGIILSERNVLPSLNELDRLIEDAKRRKTEAMEHSLQAPIPPHTLPAKQLYISHLAPSLSTYSNQMKEQQDALAIENQEYLAKVLQQRKDIKALMDGLEGVVSDLNETVAALNPETMDGLGAQVRTVDESMR